MAPYLNKPLIREIDKKYIEVIGHYDNPVLCAKLTLLAELYAVEHREGYALFKVEDYDKLSFINDKLEFSVSDLTGTTWIINNNPSLPSGYGFFYINFTSNSQEFNRFVIGYDFDDAENASDWLAYQKANNEVVPAYLFGWSSEAYKTIIITGGTDVTNATLIAWLEANATQQVEPTPTGVKNVSFGNLPFESISFGNLPVEKIYIGENLVYEEGGEPTPSGYEVTFTFNESRLAYKDYVKIYDGQDNTGTLLFSDTNVGTATPTTTVTCSSGHLFVEIEGDSPVGSASITSGTITATSTLPFIFSVGSDGAVTITMNYDL